MQEALALARLGLGRTSPNPPVGAVLVRDGQIVGRGYHASAGKPHAEIVAIGEAEGKTRGADLFVTLEPCAHQGRTPPCTRQIIEAGISRVVAAVEDPNPRVKGRGFEELRRAGIQVESGLLAEEGERLIEAYACFITAGRPFVVAKWASSVDGKIATRSGDSRYISGAESQEFAHRLRNELDAILVGLGTVRIDNPQLTCRMDGGRNPLRVVLDGKANIDHNSNIAGSAKEVPTLIAVTEDADQEKVEGLSRLGMDVVRLPGVDGWVDLPSLLEELGRRDVMSLLVEGGSRTLGSFFDGGLVDKVLVHVAPVIFGGEEAPVAVGGHGVESITRALRIEELELLRLGEDILISGYLEKD